MSHVYFSNYCEQKEIVAKFAGNDKYRFVLTIPFKKRVGIHAIVIMKNPSGAGKKDEKGKLKSDDTVYRVLDYLFKHRNNYSKVSVLNLYPHVNGQTKHIRDLIHEGKEKKAIKENDEFIKNFIRNIEDEYHVIAGWGAQSDITESKYRKRIKEMLNIVGSDRLYRVGELVGNKDRYPGHGKHWYDYKELCKYSIEEISEI